MENTSTYPKRGPPPSKKIKQNELEGMPSAIAKLERIEPLVDRENNSERCDKNTEKTIPPVGTTITNWQELKWAGSYHYDSKGTWFIGNECGKWLKSPDNDSFTRLE